MQPETTPAADDDATSQPGGTPVPPPAGPPEPAGHAMTARDAYPFVRKVIG